MIYQPRNRPWCGPAALANALRAIGKRRSLKWLHSACGTTKDGTPPEGLIAAANKAGLYLTPFESSDDYFAWLWMSSNVLSGNPIILCVDQWEHWVTIVGHMGKRLYLVDSSNDEKNKRENGIHAITPKKILRRWKASARTAELRGRYYGLALTSGHPVAS